MADKSFPADYTTRGTVKPTDKLLIHNIDTGATMFTTAGELMLAGKQFQTPAFANPLILDATVYKNFTPATITGDCQIRILNPVDGDSGTIHLTVDNTGPHTITVGNAARLMGNSNIVGSNYNEIYINWYADANYVYWYFHEYVD
jgi:hypothetical protein